MSSIPSLIDTGYTPPLTGWAAKGNSASTWKSPPSVLGKGPDVTGDRIAAAGAILSVFGTLNSAVGAYYGAEAAKGEAKSRALSAEFEASISALNARRAETDAQSILSASQDEIGRYTMQVGQERAAVVASAGARGIVGGTGSSAEVLASIDLVKEIDVRTMNLNAVRAANAARTQSVNYANQSLLGRVSANNLRASARSIRPGAAAASGLLAGAGQVADRWLAYRRR